MKYQAIVADPPWSFRVWNRDTGSGRSAESHYPTMTQDRLIRLPVADIASDNCALFMWCVWPSIGDAIALGQVWGFEYKTCAFLWAKVNKSAWGRFAALDDLANWFMGMGYWTRANTEPCLLFTRGKVARKAKNVRQLIVSPIMEHSRKPDVQFGRIESLVDGPYCELFARRKFSSHWDVWGNQVEPDLCAGLQLSVEAGS